MDLSRSNGKKKTIINTNILTSISLIILYLLHSIRISKPNKRIHLTFSLSLRLVLKPLSLRLLLLHHCSRLPTKKKITLTCCECSVSIVHDLSLRLVFKPLSLHLSPFVAPPPLFQVAATKKKKKTQLH